MPRPEPILIGGASVAPGSRVDVELPVARLTTGTGMALPVVVVNGSKPGPSLWLDAAIHGDELNGIEIIRRVLRVVSPKRLRGRLYAVPVVNGFGLIQQTRYLPDRRDLNRTFPGSARGSLAARLAHLFMEEVVARCGYGIDLHTGSQHRTNLPQVRAALTDPETRRIALAFGAPVMVDARDRPGSLRSAAGKKGVPVLTYEAGETLRFDEHAIVAGVQGVLRVMATLKMIDSEVPPAAPVFEVSGTQWVRASKSGVLLLDVELGDRVPKGGLLGKISEVMSPRDRPIKSNREGLVIGLTNNPLVYRGDAIVHLAY